MNLACYLVLAHCWGGVHQFLGPYGQYLKGPGGPLAPWTGVVEHLLSWTAPCAATWKWAATPSFAESYAQRVGHGAWNHLFGGATCCYGGSFAWENWRAEPFIGPLGAYRCCPTRLGNSSPAGNGAYPGYIQLRPQTGGSLPAFGASSQSTPGRTGASDSVKQHAPRRIGKASPSVSIFARDPLCKNTCCYCRCRPCDVGVEHDDHTCYDCEQRLLHPEGVPGAPWQPPLTPGCDSWCTQCTSQRCAVRGLHDLHVCMGCERTMTFSTPVHGGWRSMGCPGMKSCDDSVVDWFDWLQGHCQPVLVWRWLCGHFLLEKMYWGALGCFTLVLLCFSLDGIDRVLVLCFRFVFCFLWCCFCLLFVFGCCSALVSLYTICLTPTLFTQKMWSSSPVSVKGHWTCSSDLCH